MKKIGGAVIINKKIGLAILCLLMILTGCTTRNSKDKKIKMALLKPKEVIAHLPTTYNTFQ
ncbi:hypothetical protein [Clostridium sp.]|uniref:hypothetical protein n=1 Tax=Clostridium sp. TaxID=1506 RepID=UPI003D6CADFA